MTSETVRMNGAVFPRVVAQGICMLLGRALFAAIFLLSSARLFGSSAVEDAAAKGVPLAGLAVPAAGVLAVAGGLSVLLGYRARIGAWLLVAFLVPVTLSMHAFWTLADPQLVHVQRIMFLKNLSMLGAALIVTQVGAGPWSLDARRSRASR